MANQELEGEKQDQSLMENIILGIAHELNNPNTFVRVNAMNLKKMINLIRPCLDEYAEKNPDEKFGPYTLPELRSKMIGLTDSILDATVRVITIADKLKQCTQFALSQAVEIDISEVLKNVVRMHEFLLQRSCRYELTVPEDSDFHSKGHQLQIEQALSIVITNAVDAIVERHKEDSKEKGLLQLSISSNEKEIILIFKDNGCGMSEALQKKIFSPYFTTKPQGVGDGIGLAMCKSIVEKHHGSVSVESKENEGSSFKIIFPKESENEHGQE